MTTSNSSNVKPVCEPQACGGCPRFPRTAGCAVMTRAVHRNAVPKIADVPPDLCLDRARERRENGGEFTLPSIQTSLKGGLTTGVLPPDSAGGFSLADLAPATKDSLSSTPRRGDLHHLADRLHRVGAAVLVDEVPRGLGWRSSSAWAKTSASAVSLKTRLPPPFDTTRPRLAAGALPARARAAGGRPRPAQRQPIGRVGSAANDAANHAANEATNDAANHAGGFAAGRAAGTSAGGACGALR